MITLSGWWYMTLRNCWLPRPDRTSRGRQPGPQGGGKKMLGLFVAQLSDQLSAIVTNLGTLLGGIL
jgi:hypothetical protein